MLDIDMYIIQPLFNKIIESIKDLCNTSIKSTYTKIVKYKAITPTIQKLKKIYINFWGLHDPLFISKKNYISLLLNKYIQKSWVLLLRSKDEFFNAFK